MKDVSANADAKRLAGEAAAGLVKSGMVVGLGTGSTVAWTIKRLGERVREEGLDFLGVPTSFQAENLAIASGIKLTTLNQHPILDLAIDEPIRWTATCTLSRAGERRTRGKRWSPARPGSS